MKILHVVCYFYPAWDYGGVPRNVYEVCKELVKLGHQVTVFTTDAYNAGERIKKKREVVDGIEIRRFSNISNYLAYYHRLFFTPSMVSAVKDNIKNYDIVHLNDYRTFPNLLVRHYARKYHLPYILEAHGSAINVIAKRWLKTIFDVMGGSKLLRDATRLIAKSPLEIQNYTDMGVNKEKIDVVPNGINPAEFTNLPPRGGFRLKYGLQPDDLIVLFLARIHKRKGIDLLISAFPDVIKKFPNAKLVVVGADDGYLPVAKNLTEKLNLENWVIFTGPLYDSDKLSAYVDADVYALPALYEIFGMTIIEALACSLPVVLTEGCAIGDVIKDQAGLVVPHAKESLAQAINTLLADEKQRKRYGEAGRKLVLERYTWAKVAKQLEGIYQACRARKI